MTTIESSKLIGKRATATFKLHDGTIEVPVLIVDVRQSFGRTDLLCQYQESKTWVSAKKVKVDQ